MENLFVEAHASLEQVGSLFVQLEKHIGHPDEVGIEDAIRVKLEGLNA